MKPLAILVVDDHPIMREVVCQILEDAGHFVREAAEGHEALRKLSCARFDLVVTDIVMPEMDGIELIGELQRRYPDIRIIAMSGGSERFPMKDIWTEDKLPWVQLDPLLPSFAKSSKKKT